MKKFISLIGLLLFFYVAAFPQRPAQIRMGVTVPSVCSSSSSQQALFYKISTTTGLYQCVSGSYVAIGGGGSGEPAITGGTSGQFWDGTKTFRAIVQADVTGLKTTDSPTFAELNTTGQITSTLTTAQLRARYASGIETTLFTDASGNFTISPSNGQTFLTAPSATKIPFTITGASGQTANLLNITSNGGSAGDLLNVSSAGVVKATGVDAPIRQNSQSTAYTLVLADSGKHVLHPSADTTARIITIPANASVAFPIGTSITIVNQNGAGVLTIAITTDTMRLAGSGATGSRTLAANGIATILKLTATEWIISGSGLS